MWDVTALKNSFGDVYHAATCNFISEKHTRTYDDVSQLGNTALLQYDSIYFYFVHLFLLLWMLCHIQSNIYLLLIKNKYSIDIQTQK